MPENTISFDGDPLWYKDAIIYELHIKAFFDGNNDGVGDFRGLTQKLDYLKDLGITAVWLLPFYPSPLRDDGYDIANFFDVHPHYGTLKDFRQFLREAHKRGLRVITELVLNHTSDQHPWFQRARRAKPGSAYRDFYVWSDSPKKYADARIIFQDFETSNWTWDPLAKAYFWHRFYAHQPDLNYDNPAVRKAMFKVIDFWMRMGVDGMRLDAVPYLIEREETNCENLPETYQYLRELREHVDSNFKGRMLLAEANQWPEDAVAYFGAGDMCNMAFHFPLMPRMFMAFQMEDSFPIIDILDQTPQIPEECQWALFLRNHDELTLEMVTDEERDYMYRIYARDPRARINLGIRRRLAPLLENDLRRIKLIYGVLFSLPGTPVIYYGDEICMGDNYYLGDRDGVRTPMQWSPDKNAGFSRADPQQLYLPPVTDFAYHYQTTNVETEEKNPSSFLWWSRRVIAIRKRFKVFGRGSLKIIQSSNSKIISFVREYGDEKILIAANLSRLSQMSTLDLSDYAGLVPEEFISRNKFHPIGEDPYILTFAPYAGFYFLLSQAARREVCIGMPGIQPIEVGANWNTVFDGKTRKLLEDKILPAYISGCRWFGGKARQVLQFRIAEMVPISRDPAGPQIVLMNVDYTEGSSDRYVILLGFAEGEEVAKVSTESPSAVVARLKVAGREGILFDGLYSETVCKELFRIIARRRSMKVNGGEIVAHAGKGLGNDALKVLEHIRPSVLKADQSNTAVLFGEEYFLKLYRHPDEGLNPDLELTRFLTEEAHFEHVPAFAGGIELKRKGGERITLGILQRYVPNQGDALNYVLAGLNQFYEAVLAMRTNGFPELPLAGMSLLDLALQEVPLLPATLSMGVPEEMVWLLGDRTAEMHLALASGTADPLIAPERFSTLWQRSVFQSMQALQKRTFQLLASNIARFPKEIAGEASGILPLGNRIIAIYRTILTKKILAKRIRTHGDYHLGQLLYTGKDFVIIDFEGEPARPLGERRIKLSPLKDVAGMIRSFHYAAYLALLKGGGIREEDAPSLEPWAELWYRSMSAIFLRAYLGRMKDGDLIPQSRRDLETLLNCFLLDKAVYELGYELNNRPEWVTIPVRGIRYLVESADGSEKQRG
ncbi:MAG: maltose alpha-D-glucosyltransferase [Syntrophobacteraceae bacterium]